MFSERVPKWRFYGEEEKKSRIGLHIGLEQEEVSTSRAVSSFCDVDHPEELPLSQVGVTFPLNDDAFLSFGHEFKNSAGEVEVVGSDGHIKFRHDLSKRETPSYYSGAWATPDEHVDRFTFIVETRRGGSRALDISGKRVARRVAVYSEAGQELASLPVSTTYHRDFDFSLSPDGIASRFLTGVS
jgi:hypothetical protein